MQEINNVVANLAQQTSNHNSYEVPFKQYTQNIGIGPNGFYYTHDTNNTFTLSTQAVDQLIGSDKKFSKAILLDTDVPDSMKQEYLRLKLNKQDADIPVHIKTTARKVDGFIASGYGALELNTILGILATVGMMYPEMRVHSYYLKGRKLFVRLIDKAWEKALAGENYYGSVVLVYDALNPEGIELTSAIARIACFNFTVSESTFTLPDNGDISETTKMIQDYISEMDTNYAPMLEQLGFTRDIKVPYPNSLISTLLERIKAPDNVIQKSIDYWEREGHGKTLFDVVQAITWGTQEFTTLVGKQRVPKWDERNQFEIQIWNWAKEMLEAGKSEINDHELIKKSSVLSIVTNDLEKQRVMALKPFNA